VVSNLSLKLYHGGKLRWGYQQFMTEAPAKDYRNLQRQVRKPGAKQGCEDLADAAVSDQRIQ
jgi:hypothetical protein